MSFNTGKALEARIMTAVNIYGRRELLLMRKVDPPSFTRYVGGKTVTTLTQNPFLDFVGTWTERSGRALFIEAKSTAEPRLPFGGDACVTIQQMEALRSWSHAGAAVGIIWEHQLFHAFVSLDDLHNAAGRGRKSLDWDSAAKISEGDQCIVNFLPALRALYPE
jgi:hypothetical protein